MKNLKVQGTGSPYGTGRQHITVSNPNFHSRLMKRHSPVEKRFLSFPLLFFREGTGGGQVWKNRFCFPVHFQFIKQILSQAFCKKETKVKNRLLQFFLRGGEHGVHQGVPDIRGMIPGSRDAARKMIPSTQKGVHFRYSSGNEGFYPVMGSVAATKILHREIPGRNLLYGSVTAPETVKSAFFPDEKSRRLVNKTDPRKKTPEKSPGKPVLAKRETQDLNRPILKSLVAKSIVTGNVTGNKFPDTNAVPGETFHGRNAVPGKFFPVRNPVSRRVLLDRTAVYEGSAILNSTYFPGLAANFNSRLIVPSDPVFEPEPVVDRFPAKGVYPQASGKELVFNTGAGVSQELEQEVAAIKEELLKAEQASQTSYSSLYSKIEKELKQKLEINRISEQVLQQIVWRLKIEKERRGLL